MNKHIPVIQSLLKLGTEVKWYGSTASAKHHRMGCDGQLTSFILLHEGLIVRIAKAVYVKNERVRTNPDERFPDKDPVTYYEIEIKDVSARFGRRCPLRPSYINAHEEEWDAMGHLYDFVSSNNEIFVPGFEFRMSKDECLTKLASVFSKKAPSS